jgi:glycerol-3-phosphate acyltransferase PlsX
MGGDHGPSVILPAVKRALTARPDISFILCGNKDLIDANVLYSGYESRIEIVHCVDHVAMDEKPVAALRRKKQSSMWKMLEQVAEARADACVSSGNTGALMAMAQVILRTLPGIERPALASSLPTRDHSKVLLLDLGANVNCDSENLVQYAVMGAVLVEQIHHISQPRIGLLNVGEEQVKGNDRVKSASSQLEQLDELNYIGYVEGDSIFFDKADVVVTDGFAGNIALKSCEGIAKLIIHELKYLAIKNWLTRLLSGLTKPLLQHLYRRMNPDQYNGASLLGLRNIVVKSHGNASSDAFFYAIQEAIGQAEQQVPEKIKLKIETLLAERP